MTKLIVNEKEAFADLKRIMQSWDVNENNTSQKLIDLFLRQLIQSKWDREKIYKFAFLYIKNNLSDSDYDNIPEAAFDYLDDIKSSIIGHCSYDSILKFPNEPKNKNELISYVRGEKWKN
jgi:hypothetical protein